MIVIDTELLPCLQQLSPIFVFAVRHPTGQGELWGRPWWNFKGNFGIPCQLWKLNSLAWLNCCSGGIQSAMLYCLSILLYQLQNYRLLPSVIYIDLCMLVLCIGHCGDLNLVRCKLLQSPWICPLSSVLCKEHVPVEQRVSCVQWYVVWIRRRFWNNQRFFVIIIRCVEFLSCLRSINR